MTMQLVGQLVKIEGDVAVLALGDPAADLADLVGRVSAAFWKRMTCLEFASDDSMEACRPGLRMTLFFSLLTILPGVDDLDGGQGDISKRSLSSTNPYLPLDAL